MKKIEFWILVILLIFYITSCINKTSISYEFGRGYRKIRAEFSRGLTTPSKE